MVFIFTKGTSELAGTYGFQVQEPPSEMHPGSTSPTSGPEAGQPESPTSTRRREFRAMMHDALTTFDFDAFLAEPPHTFQGEPGSPPPQQQQQQQAPHLTRIGRRPVTPPPHIVSSYDRYINLSCDPPTDDEEDSTPDSVLDDRRRRTHVAFDSDSDHGSDDIGSSLTTRTIRQWPTSRPITWTPRIPMGLTVAPRPPGPQMPYTRFFIESKKHVVSIKFNPPV